MNKFPDRLKELRLEKGLSQRKLSAELQISQAAIARWEANLQTPNIDVVIKIAEFFNVTVDFLLGLED